MLKRDFVPGFRVGLHHKVMGIVASAARDAGLAMPLGAPTAQLVDAPRAEWHSSLDRSALLPVEQHCGRGSRSAQTTSNCKDN